jgi:hypothetical protein
MSSTNYWSSLGSGIANRLHTGITGKPTPGSPEAKAQALQAEQAELLARRSIERLKAGDAKLTPEQLAKVELGVFSDYMDLLRRGKRGDNADSVELASNLLPIVKAKNADATQNYLNQQAGLARSQLDYLEGKTESQSRLGREKFQQQRQLIGDTQQLERDLLGEEMGFRDRTRGDVLNFLREERQMIVPNLIANLATGAAAFLA